MVQQVHMPSWVIHGNFIYASELTLLADCNTLATLKTLLQRIMKITTTTDAIDRAIEVFDKEYRGDAGWIGWEKKRSQKYALQHAGKIYPPKKIVSLAIDLPVTSFYGGSPTNTLLRNHGFTVVELAHTKKSLLPIEIPRFKVGRNYSRKAEITGKFGGNNQSGIAASIRAPAIFVFTDESGEQFGYKDHFDEFGNFIYTGEGKVGDMVMSNGNLAITGHAMSGRGLYLFKGNGKGKPYTFLGEFIYGSHELQRGPDENGDDREIIVFCLVPIGATSVTEDTEDDGDEEDVPTNGKPKAPKQPLDLATLRAAAIAATTTVAAAAPPKKANRTVYRRCEQVKEYVLARANGDCELCDKPAPFLKADGSPYLEPHHINRVSDGGLDHPIHVGAICPTCHTHIHQGIGGSALNEELRTRILEKEAEISEGVTVGP